MAQQKTVTITVNPHGINVDPDPVHVSKSKGDSVRWNIVLNHGRLIHIDFSDDPFHEGNAPGHYGRTGSGPIDTNAVSSDAKVGDSYKYRIDVKDNQDKRVASLDPQVIVDNG